MINYSLIHIGDTIRLLSLSVVPGVARGHGLRDYLPADKLPWGEVAGTARVGCYAEDGTYLPEGMPGAVTNKVAKFNPNHDERGRFATADGSSAAADGGTDLNSALARAQETARGLGYDPNKIRLASNPPPEVQYGGNTHVPSAAANLKDDTIDLYPTIVDEDLEDIITHEVMHQKWGKVFEVANHQRLNPRGNQEVYREIGRVLEDQRIELMERDGVSDYSIGWWKEVRAGRAPVQTAVHETLAEIARLSLHTEMPRALKEGPWGQLYASVIRLYPTVANWTPPPPKGLFR